MYIECCWRKERSAIARFLAGIWQLRGERGDVDKGRCLICLGEEDAKHILLDCKKTKHWRMKLIHDKWSNTNKEVAYRKIIKIKKKHEVHIQNLGKYLRHSQE